MKGKKNKKGKHWAEHEVVVSMTSFPGAIDYVAGAVSSLLNGAVLPDRIVLYISPSQFEGKELPEELKALERDNEIFEIRPYEPDIRSYRKLVPALDDFPNAIIVTVDDDVAYDRHMLESLLKLHLRFPNHILAHRAKRILPDKPYKKWKKYRWYHFLFRRYYDRYDTVQTGVGGVLYPPVSLDTAMIKRELFTRIAPTNDDIWFWAAAVANGRRVLPVPFGYNKPKGLGKPRELSLKSVNFKGSEVDRNRLALDGILDEYPQIKTALRNVTAPKPGIPEKIDLVYLWVNGNDPEWQAKRARFSGTTRATQAQNGEGRYANNDELKYSLRSVDKYAPWINHIYIVTDGQTPEWLDTGNPRISIVDHSEILPSEALPTFNSTVIEHAIHRIPGLSEHFIYANDDSFINRPVRPSDFFYNDGRPILRLNRRPLRRFSLWFKGHILGKPLSNYNRTIQTSARLIQDKFGRYIGHKTHHNIDAYRRSDYARAYALFRDRIEATYANHIRHDSDVQRNLYTYYAIVTGRGRVEYVGPKTSFRLHIDKPCRYAKLERLNPTFFCLNDSEYSSEADRKAMAEFMERRFPDKSAFEL